MKKPQLISAYLAEHLRNSIGEETSKGLDNIVVCRKCREILGPTISNYISDVTFSNGELRIKTNSAVLKNDLFVQRSMLLEKINAALTSPIVMSVYIQ